MPVFWHGVARVDYRLYTSERSSAKTGNKCAGEVPMENEGWSGEDVTVGASVELSLLAELAQSEVGSATVHSFYKRINCFPL